MKRLALLVSLTLCVASSLAGTRSTDVPQSAGQPDLARRIRAQAALEEVYWRHRLWPETNPGTKPPLRDVLPEAALRAKALDPLRKSAALDALWNRPVNAAALQSEIDRMVLDTHAPDTLRELFAALDNDPSMIAECLARPLVADRLVRRFYARDDRMHETVRRRAESALARAGSLEDAVRAGGRLVEYRAVLDPGAPVEDGAAEQDAPGTRRLDAPAWRALLNRLASDLGEPASVEKIEDPRALPHGRLSPLREDDERFYTTELLEADGDSVKVAEVEWPKQSFDDWWREASTRYSAAIPAAGTEYVVPALPGTSCTVGTWTPLHAWTPPARSQHTAVWTGSEMLVWGGVGPSTGGGMVTGGRYDPATDAWSVMGTAGGPVARTAHTAVWTGARMIVWGGLGTTVGTVPGSTGGLYDPITDTWTLTRADATAPDARYDHTATWTGSRMIVWGGSLTSTPSGSTTYTGGSYDPATDTWQTTRADATTAQPRKGHTAVWTGSRMIVWGGEGDGTYPLSHQTGARYDPVADTWEATRLDATTPGSRSRHFTVWTGSRMVIWGGYQRTNPNSPNSVALTTGAQYDPLSDTWQPTRNDGTQPPANTIQHSMWTGAAMLLWGSTSSPPFTPLGRRYDPAADLWLPMSTTGAAPSPRGASSAVWTGEEMIVWGGSDRSTSKRLNTGGRYDPDSDTWVPTASDQSAPGPRSNASAVWTGSEMIVWGGVENNYVKTGHRYDPATDSWQPVLADASAPEERAYHSAVWTGLEMIVWGGALATGGRYNPASDSWAPTRFDGSTPAARSLNTAVWSGTEMIVWGGSGGSGNLKTGGRYNPDSDSWIATMDDASTPSARSNHSAVWTGSAMIIWGGSDVGFNSAVNTGGRYNPVLNTWAPTRADVSTPPARQYQSAVWTGDRMIVWGGVTAFSFTPLQNGGRYDPVTDTWVSTSLAGPSARYKHSAHWTGSEMIIWGGNASGVSQNTGGLYHPGFNTWTLTPINAKTPAPREDHVSVLSGNGLIVWGGQGTDSGAELCLCSPAATWYQDLDGDGFGTASAVISSCQQPAGYASSAGDCNDDDASSWSTPGEALDFMFEDETQMHWSPPSSPGGLQSIYDVLRSQVPDDFVGSAVCISTNTPTAFDAEVPPAGAAFFFRVRARNGCGGIGGPLGNDSSGTPVDGRSCP